MSRFRFLCSKMCSEMFNAGSNFKIRIILCPVSNVLTSTHLYKERKIFNQPHLSKHLLHTLQLKLSESFVSIYQIYFACKGSKSKLRNFSGNELTNIFRNVLINVLFLCVNMKGKVCWSAVSSISVVSCQYSTHRYKVAVNRKLLKTRPV